MESELLHFGGREAAGALPEMKMSLLFYDILMYCAAPVCEEGQDELQLVLGLVSHRREAAGRVSVELTVSL